MCAALIFLFSFATGIFACPLRNRIVGGQNATIEDFPYQASLLYDGQHLCGAAIISETWLISAAHCITDAVNKYSVRVGSTTRSTGGVIYSIEQMIIHENYNRPIQFSNDIVALKVSKTLSFSRTVQRIAVPNENAELADGAKTVITGWGSTVVSGPFAEILQKAYVPIVNFNKCKKLLSSINEVMLCAGYDEGGVDACQGDSGGPLVFNGIIHGVASWGRNCANPNSPGVYTKVSALRSWIRQNTGV